MLVKTAKGLQSILLYLPTQIRFPIGGERVTCHGSTLTNSLGKQRLKLSTRSCTFETAANSVLFCFELEV